jgi:hypothetical protein
MLFNFGQTFVLNTTKIYPKLRNRQPYGKIIGGAKAQRATLLRSASAVPDPKTAYLRQRIKAWFPSGCNVTVVKIESRSFSSADIQHFRTENTRSDYRTTEYLITIYMWFTGINYYKLVVEDDCVSIFTTVTTI